MTAKYEDLLKKAAIEECAALISPGKSVDELFEIGGEFHVDSSRWQEAIAAFHSSFKSSLGNKISKATIKENLFELRKKLRNEHGPNNFIEGY